MSNEVRTPTLATVGHGAAEELFGDALARVMANVDDPNTKATAKRTITLRVTITPNEKRDAASINVSCDVKVAAVAPVESVAMMGRHEGRLALVEALRQEDLFTTPEAKLESVAGGKGVTI